MTAADQAIQYLYATRHLAIEFDGNKDDCIVIAGDASFEDDVEDRRSSQGYISRLEGIQAIYGNYTNDRS